MEELLNKLIDLRTKQNEKLIITLGEVTEVRDSDCDIARPQMPPLLGVRYHAIVNTSTNYITIVPKKGSKVLCGIIENHLSEAVILTYSDIEKINITIDGAAFAIEDGKFTLKNKSADLKDILEKTLDTLGSATITTPTGPGAFSPNNTTTFSQQKAKIDQLFN